MIILYMSLSRKRTLFAVEFLYQERGGGVSLGQKASRHRCPPSFNTLMWRPNSFSDWVVIISHFLTCTSENGLAFGHQATKRLLLFRLICFWRWHRLACFVFPELKFFFKKCLRKKCTLSSKWLQRYFFFLFVVWIFFYGKLKTVSAQNDIFHSGIEYIVVEV